MRKFSILLLTAVLIFAFFAPAKPTEAVVLNPTLWISPQKRLVATGSSVIVEVKITEATFSYGLNCQIEYDPQMLEIDKESVIEGEFYRQDGAPTYFLRKVDNVKGLLIVGVSRYNDRNNSYGPVAGDGLVFYFVAKAKFVGEAALSFNSVDMVNLRYQQGETFMEEVSLKTEESFINCVAKDNVAPVVTITKSPTPETNENIGKFKWSGTDDSTPPDRIQFSYKLEDPVAGGRWSDWEYRTDAAVTFLREGKNCFFVKARDERGNESTPVSLCIEYDMTGPTLELQPLPPEVYDPTLEVCGITDLPETGVSLLVNGARVPINSKGEFCQTLRLFMGTNTVHVSAIDKAGNMEQQYFTINYITKTKVEMWINNPNVLIDGKSTICDPAPLIVAGRTMVPLRFLSDAFGMDIEWIASSRQIDITWSEVISGQRISHKMMMWIDKTTYNLDGKTQVMDSPPTIINDRTVVPFRFIATAFGAEVEWDGNERKVTIEYVRR